MWAGVLKSYLSCTNYQGAFIANLFNLYVYFILFFCFSDQYIGRLVHHDIVESLVEALEDALELCQLNKKLANIPLQVSQLNQIRILLGN